MILFFSDVHLGRGAPADERAVEADLVACLRAHAEAAEALYLVGDVFDAYIEYPTLVPRGFARLQGLLAAWTDRGVPVTYLAGNHDPWHRDYFERELGVRVVPDACTAVHHGRRVHLAHGDGLEPGLYRRLKPVLRHPVPVWLYRTLLPADAGFRLARWVSRRYSRLPPDAATRDALRDHARRLLHRTEADLVVLGHSHHAELRAEAGGAYLNPGCWHTARTFGRLDADGPRLLRWNGDRTREVDSEG